MHICVLPMEKYHTFTVKLELPLVLPLSIFTKPSTRAGYDTRSILKRSLTGLNSEFSFSMTSCLTKAEEPSLPYYLPIDKGRIIGFIPFPRVLVLCKMQSVLSRIWTPVAMPISYDDNHYTMVTLVLSLSLLEMKLVTQVKILNRTLCVPLHANALERIYLFSPLPPAKGK